MVARYTSVRSLISIAVEMGWKIHQMDVKTAFLNGVIQEITYVEQPQGFEIHGRESHVCRLKKALYGLKQAPRAWYSRIDSYSISAVGLEDPSLTLGFSPKRQGKEKALHFLRTRVKERVEREKTHFLRKKEISSSIHSPRARKTRKTTTKAAHNF